METTKIIASVMAAALGVTTAIPFGSTELVTYADETYKLGDVNNDGLVDANDASDVLEEYSLLSTGKNPSFSEAQKKAADVDKNSDIDASDASIILAYYSYVSTGGSDDMQKFINTTLTAPVESTTTTATTKTTAKTTTTTTATGKTTTTTLETSPATTTKSADKTTATTTKSTEKTTATTTSTEKTTATTTATTAKTTTGATSATTTHPDKISGIRVSRTEMNINVGQGELAASVTFLPSTAKNTAEIWSSSDDSIATVDKEGWVIGKKEGSCTITVRSAENSDIFAEITVNVTDIHSVKDIRLSRNSMFVKVGEGELSANVTMLPTTAVNKAEKWSSSDESIATVDNEGWVIGKKAGSCAITVQSVDNPAVFAVIVVTVYDGEQSPTTSAVSTTATTTSTTTSEATTTTATNIKVTDIKLSKHEMTIPIGGKDIALVTLTPSYATIKDEIWVSSDESIATVDKYGWVKGVAEGECKITVYSVSDPSVFDEIKVKVVDDPTLPIEPDVNFSYVLGDKSDAKNLAFYTPIPKNASGRFIIDYKITDANGKTSTVTSTILAPEMTAIVTMLTAETNTFMVEAYVTNLETSNTAKMGSYEFVINPRDARTITENISYAFSVIGGLK